MAHSLSAQKRIRQNVKHRARNRWRLTTMREAVKTFQEKLAHGSVDEATAAFRACSRVIDRTAQKGVIHKNQAARRKSRLSARLKAKKTGTTVA
jgi:small subunit ribosomal protein S20